MIYLDNAATTPLAPEVLEAMRPFLEGEFGNASSVYRLGSRARVALEEAREVIARAIHAEPREIVFTSGGTEANNAAIKGALFKHYADHFSGKPWSDLQVLTSPVEHHAVLEPMEWIAKLGASVTYVPVSPFGRVLLESVSERLSSETALVSLMMVNNETGAINPVSEISNIVKSKSKALIHSDAVHALGKIPIDVKELGIDFISLSAHKIHGPKGIGALYIKSGTPWEPLLHGGPQERNRRGGTEPVALAVGFAEAVKMAAKNLDRVDDIGRLRKYLLNKLGEIPEVVFNSGFDDSSIDSIINFSFIPEVLARLDADALIIRFDLEGIAVSNGSACTSGSQQPSHVLLAMGKSKEVAAKSVRASFSRYNTVADIDRLIEAVKKILASLSAGHRTHGTHWSNAAKRRGIAN
ncbi:MAG TPA: cysteine desulfurase family protein [Candidatus Kapabacteria bacterium]|nr:cysteine desulfurase family protein [Candidatus Kapabacteria bacterium]